MKNRIAILCMILLGGLGLSSLHAQGITKPQYIPQWTTYTSETADNKFAEVVVDLGMQPIVPAMGFPHQCSFLMRLQKPDSTGLKELKSPQTLAKIESNLIFAIGQLGGLYYAKVTSNGLRDYYFYLPDTSQFRATCKQVIAAYPGYTFSTQIEHDPYWFNYYNVYPDEYVLQIQYNTNKLSELTASGDSLALKRTVEHFANFPTLFDRDEFEKDIIRYGYTVIGKGENEGDLKYGILFGRRHPIDSVTIQQITLELVDLAMKNGGYYDGWESEPMIKK